MNTFSRPKFLVYLPAVCAVFLAALPAAVAQVPGAFAPAYNSPVLDQGAQVVVIQPADNKAIIGGAFSTFNGASVNPLLRLNADGSLDSTFASSAGILVPRENANVNALLVQPDGKVVVAAFGTTTGTPTLTRLNANGTLDPSFTTTLPDGGVFAMSIQPDGKIVVAGQFYSVNGTASTAVARLNPDGSTDPSFASPLAPDGSGSTLLTQAAALLLQPDGKIVLAGTIYTASGSVNGLVRLNADGSVDPSFPPISPDNGSFLTLALQADGKILVSGGFTSIKGIPVPNIARFSGVDGTLDQSFAAGGIFNAGFNQLVVQADGKILASNNAGGGITLVRLNTDGSIDRDYSPGFLLDQSTVTALALQPDGLGVVSGTLIVPVPQGNQPNVSVVRLLASGLTAATTLNVSVPGSAKVWLGPNGAVDQSGEGDSLLNASPVRATGLALTPGSTLSFSATGLVDNIDRGAAGSATGPDGDGLTESESTQNGLSGVLAGGDSLLGVFIDDRAADPTNANAPASLNFGDPVSGVPGGIDYTTLQPLLGQVFFIGDGKTSSGVTQQVTVPAGATHLVFGTVDYGTWSDNTGGFNVTVSTGAGTSSTPLTATTLTLTGANLGAAVAKGTPLTFTATQGATGSLSVRVQASLTPTVESSWTDLPDATNGGAGFLKGDGKGDYSLTTTQYPSGNVSFRAISASSNQTDSISNVLQSYAIDIALLVVNPDDLGYTVEGHGTTSQVVPDDKIDYSLTVRNTGFEPATGLVVQVTFDPVNTKLLNTKTKKVSDGGTAAGSVITWNLPSLANGDHHTFTFSVKVDANVDIKNGIHTGAGVHSAGSNAGLVYINASSVPEIALFVVPPFNISVSNNGAQTAAGGPLTFTFAITNRSSDTISNISAYVPLPSGYLPANFKTAQLLDGNGNPVGSPFKLGAAVNGGTDQNAVLVTVPSLGAGQVQQFIVTVNVPYSAAPSSDVTLPEVQLTGYASDGSQLTYAQANYIAQLSNQPPAAPPNLVLQKIVPTTVEIQALQALATAPAPTNGTPSPLVKSAKQLFTALSGYTGIPVATLEATPASQIASVLNPYVSRDTDPDTGDTRYEAPSPNTKQPAPYVTYLLVYFNTGQGAAAGITILDAAPQGLQVDPASIVVKGAALTSPGSVLGSDGRSLTFTFGQIKAGVGGAILYHALIPAPGAGGPNLGDTIPPVTTSLTTASLSNQFFYTLPESLLITGKADASVSATETDPGDGTAVYNILYRNTGGQNSKDFVVVSEVPADSTFQSAQFLDINQNGTAAGAGQVIHDPVHENTGGKVIFELGKVKPQGLGFVQVVYKLNDLVAVPNAIPGLVHHYYVDGSTFPGAPILSSIRGGRPEPRVVLDGPHPRFGFGDLLGAIKNGLASVGHAIGGFFTNLVHPPPTTAPTLWVSRVAPLSVQEDTDFTYLVTVGDCGKTLAYQTQLQLDVPTGATFKSASEGTYYPNGNVFTYFPNTDDSLLAHEAHTITITFHATAKAGSTIDSRFCSFSGFADNAYDFGTGAVDVGRTSTYVYSAAQAATFDALKGTIVNNAASAGGVDPFSLSAGLAYSPHLNAVTPQSTQTTIAHADFISLTNGATIVAQGGGNIVAQGGGNIVAQGGGNIVAQGGGNIVAQGGGNIVINGVTGFSGSVNVSDLLSAQGIAAIVAQGGGNIVAQGGGNIVAQGGGNIVNFANGNPLISISSLQPSIVEAAGLGNAITSGLISNDGGSVISNDGGSAISRDGAGIVSQQGGGIYADGGAALVGTGSGGNAQRFGDKPVRRTLGIPSGVTLGSPTNSVHLDFNDAGSLVFGVGGSQPTAQ